MPFDFGDGVLAPFPFTSQTAFKQRPAVVVSTRAYNASRPDVVIMPITSQFDFRSGQIFGEVCIIEWQRAKLLKPSAIKPIFATLEQRLIIKKPGALQLPDLSALHFAIAAILG